MSVCGCELIWSPDGLIHEPGCHTVGLAQPSSACLSPLDAFDRECARRGWEVCISRHDTGFVLHVRAIVYNLKGVRHPDELIDEFLGDLSASTLARAVPRLRSRMACVGLLPTRP